MLKRLLTLTLCLLLLLAGCGKPVDGPGMERTTESASAAAPQTTAPETTAQPTDPPGPGTQEYTLEREPGTNQLIFYWLAKDVDLSRCDMWIWFPNADGKGYLFHRTTAAPR